MPESAVASDVLRHFAEGRRLEATEGGELPRCGSILERPDLKVIATATGALSGDEKGTLAHVTYTYKSGDVTRTACLTLVIIALPQTIGFFPYLHHSANESHPALDDERFPSIRAFTPAGSELSVRVHDGTSEGLLHELFSPGLLHWLARSPEGFAFELDRGVLCVSREGHVERAADLERLCADAAHLSQALREEAGEEIATDAAGSAAAKPSKRQRREDEMAERLIPLVSWPAPPLSIDAAVGAYRKAVAGEFATYRTAVVRTLAIMIGVNIIGGGIYGLLVNLPKPLVFVLIFQAIIVAIVLPGAIRSTIESRAKLAGTEAFFRQYAVARKLVLTDPLAFAATHADAGFAEPPDRVLVGSFAGGDGALALTGDGSERGDVIALVAGPTGPVTSAELEAPAPGISARLLDDYTARLATELHEAARPATR